MPDDPKPQPPTPPPPDRLPPPRENRPDLGEYEKKGQNPDRTERRG